MSGSVLITRNSADHSTRGQRVYVTGPHFGIDVYSSTFNRAEATRYDRAEAEKLVASKWQNLIAQIEEAP